VMVNIRRERKLGTKVARSLLSILLFVHGGCFKRTESLAQQRLKEWLPPSAYEIISRSTGHPDDTTFITFVCSESDLKSLRTTFANTNGASWARLPLDRRTADILNLARTSLKIDPALLPSAESRDVEYLNLPESAPYHPVGQAIVLDAKKNRFWYIRSEM
jgi:hypothetical protein